MIKVGINLNKKKVHLIPEDDGDAKLIAELARNIGILDYDAHEKIVTVTRIGTTMGDPREIFEIQFHQE